VTEENNLQYDMPDEAGHFGPYGGKFVAETLMVPIKQLDEAYQKNLILL